MKFSTALLLLSLAAYLLGFGVALGDGEDWNAPMVMGCLLFLWGAHDDQ